MYNAINIKKISVIQENEKINNDFILYKLFDSLLQKKHEDDFQSDVVVSWIISLYSLRCLAKWQRDVNVL